MRELYKLRTQIAIALTAVIVVCFFLPWIKVHFTAAATVKELLRGENSAPILTSSGAGMPRTANGESSKIFIRVFGMFFDSVENADKKIYLVWLAVILPIAVTALAAAFKGKRAASTALGALCVAVAIGAASKILMTDLNGMVVRVQICPALWTTVLAFLLMGLLHLASIPIERK